MGNHLIVASQIGNVSIPVVSFSLEVTDKRVRSLNDIVLGHFYIFVTKFIVFVASISRIVDNILDAQFTSCKTLVSCTYTNRSFAASDISFSPIGCTFGIITSISGDE